MPTTPTLPPGAPPAASNGAPAAAPSARKPKRKKASPPTKPKKGPEPSIYKIGEIPDSFAAAVKRIEKSMKTKVFLLINTHDQKFQSRMDSLDHGVLHKVVANRAKIPREPITILLDSPGGSADHTFWLTQVFQACCRKYTVIVPNR